MYLQHLLCYFVNHLLDDNSPTFGAPPYIKDSLHDALADTLMFLNNNELLFIKLQLTCLQSAKSMS